MMINPESKQGLSDCRGFVIGIHQFNYGQNSTGETHL